VIDFIRSDFFPIKEFIDLNSLTKTLDQNLVNLKISSNFIINDISSLNVVRNNSLVFISENKFYEKLLSKDICIISDNARILDSKYPNIMLVDDLSDSYNLIINSIYHHEDSFNYNDDFDFVNGSYVSKYSKISQNVKIGNNCVIGRGVSIGDGSIIKHNVVIKNSILGKNIIICDNSSIGTTGFGFDFKKRGSSFLNPQIGIVYIDDNSHIGSSCTIDRAKIDTTFIGKNCMIDNLVHIGHNVILSDNACIAAQSGISGSVNIGPNITIGGQTGLAGHIKIGKNVTIAAKSGVTKNLNDNSIVAGFPATDIKEWKKIIINERKNRYK